jgi:hypothetical protein
MTRTQLQSMSVRDLVEYARRAHLNLMQPDGDLLLELAERLDDCYVFTSEDHHTHHRNVYTEEEKALLMQPNPILEDLTWEKIP